ncbi:MAG: hypothetical protein RTU92_03550 [Candidatus Thorarchaeota archaeon]
MTSRGFLSHSMMPSFRAKIDGTVYPVGRSSSRLKKVTIEDYLFIEQNPKNKSQWAVKAREGHRHQQHRKYVNLCSSAK